MAVTVTVLTGAIAVGGVTGTALAWGVVTDDPTLTGKVLLAAGVVVLIAADLLYMAPQARDLFRLYRQDLRAWRDARYCRRKGIPVEGLGVEVQARVAATLRADADRLIDAGGAS
jgi:hypothetical protein